jgi:hypothetical protein
MLLNISLNPNMTIIYCTIYYLILIKFTVLVLLFTLILKRDDHKTHEDVHHKEGNDDDVDKEEDKHQGAVIVDRTAIFSI